MKASEWILLPAGTWTQGREMHHLNANSAMVVTEFGMLPIDVRLSQLKKAA